MPIQVLAYACKFKCKRRVQVSRAAVELHEATCFQNPARRACQTCANRAWDSQTIYNPSHGGNPGATDYDVRVPYCQVRDDVDLPKQLVFDCPLWAPF